MTRKIEKIRLSTDRESLMFYCPGCGHHHAVRVEGDGPGPVWGWNGSEELPTLSPSVLVYLPNPDGSRGRTECHLWVKEGRIQYLKDSAHHLAGQTIDMEDIDA